MKNKIFAIGALSLLALTSCFQAKNSKQLYKVDEDAWHQLFQEGKALDPFSNVSINITNGGKVCFGTNDYPDIQIFITNGYIHIRGYQEFYYYVPSDSYDKKTDTYKGVETYEADSQGVWQLIGTSSYESLSFLAFYITPALRIENLKMSEFEFDNKYNTYNCDKVTSKGYWLPNDPTFTLTDVAIHFREGSLQTLEYFISDQNTKITAAFYDYGNTIVERSIS